MAFVRDGAGKFGKALEGGNVKCVGKEGEGGGGKVWDFQDMMEEIDGSDWTNPQIQ